jgi:hypothetical protein
MAGRENRGRIFRKMCLIYLAFFTRNAACCSKVLKAVSAASLPVSGAREARRCKPLRGFPHEAVKHNQAHLFFTFNCAGQ